MTFQAVEASRRRFLLEFLLELLGPEPEVAIPARDYLQISFLGLLFQFLYIVFQTILRSVGDVKTPLLIVLFTVPRTAIGIRP